jgi:hypothetical protein
MGSRCAQWLAGTAESTAAAAHVRLHVDERQAVVEQRVDGEQQASTQAQLRQWHRAQHRKGGRVTLADVAFARHDLEARAAARLGGAARQPGAEGFVAASKAQLKGAQRPVRPGKALGGDNGRNFGLARRHGRARSQAAHTASAHRRHERIRHPGVGEAPAREQRRQQLSQVQQHLRDKHLSVLGLERRRHG